MRRPGRRAGLVALGTCGEGDGSSDDEGDDRRAGGGTGCTDALIRSRNAMASSSVVPSARGANGLTVGGMPLPLAAGRLRSWDRCTYPRAQVALHLSSLQTVASSSKAAERRERVG